MPSFLTELTKTLWWSGTTASFIAGIAYTLGRPRVGNMCRAIAMFYVTLATAVRIERENPGP